MNKKSIQCATSLFFLSLCFHSSPSKAVEYQSPRVMSLGGSSRAGPVLNDAIYLNPAYSSFTPMYTLAGGWTAFDKKRNYSVAIQDSRTELFQAGLAFTRRQQNSAINIGASRKIIEGLSGGLGAKILLDDVTNNMTTDSIFSVSSLISNTFFASFVVDNLLETKNGKNRNLYRTFSVGTKYRAADAINLYFDPSYSPNYAAGKKSGFAGGVEFTAMSDFFIRFGRFVNGEIPHLNTRGTGFGYGAGWLGPRLSIDFAIHRAIETDNQGPAVTAHALSMTVFF